LRRDPLTAAAYHCLVEFREIDSPSADLVTLTSDLSTEHILDMWYFLGGDNIITRYSLISYGAFCVRAL